MNSPRWIVGEHPDKLAHGLYNPGAIQQFATKSAREISGRGGIGLLVTIGRRNLAPLRGGHIMAAYSRLTPILLAMSFTILCAGARSTVAREAGSETSTAKIRPNI